MDKLISGTALIFFCDNCRREPFVKLTEPLPVALLTKKSTNMLLRLRGAQLASSRYLSRLQAAKQPFRVRVGLTLFMTAHALFEVITPWSLAKATATRLAFSIPAKYDVLRSAALPVCDVQCLDHQLTILPWRKSPALPMAPTKIDNCCRTTPTALRTDIGDVAAPDFIWLGNDEVLIQRVLGIGTLQRCLSVAM